MPTPFICGSLGQDTKLDGEIIIIGISGEVVGTRHYNDNVYNSLLAFKLPDLQLHLPNQSRTRMENSTPKREATTTNSCHARPDKNQLNSLRCANATLLNRLCLLLFCKYTNLFVQYVSSMNVAVESFGCVFRLRGEFVGLFP